MIEELIKSIESELSKLGYRNKSIHHLPSIINRIEITLRLAQLYYFDNHVLHEADKKWCEYYSHYVHFFGNDELEKLGALYHSLIRRMEQDSCFTVK